MRYIIGIDEVGRGSLAGPIVVCAVAVPRGWRATQASVMTCHNGGRRSELSRTALRDSKKLSAEQRKAWFEYLIRQPALCYSVARIYPRRIDKINIARSANLAAHLAYSRLAKNYKLKIKNSSVYLDGGLYLGKGVPAGHFSKEDKPAIVRTVVRGDEKFTAVKIASILAKVFRDRYMARLAKRYPDYGFEIHKGYGTKAHMAAIRRHGPSEIHRLTFIKNIMSGRRQALLL